MLQRRNTKSKRIKVLIKKVKELSILCELDINIAILDRKCNKLSQFCTKKDLTVSVLGKMVRDHDKYTDSDGKKFK
jgi:hypothetical protein